MRRSLLIIPLVVVCVAFAMVVAQAQNARPRQASGERGREDYGRLCAQCHGADGHGGEHAPDIVGRVAAKSDRELMALLRQGLPQKGMPGVGATIAAEELRALIAFVRTFEARPRETPVRVSVRVLGEGGGALQGVALNRSAVDLQILSDDGVVHLLRRAGADEVYRAVTSQVDWASYNGQPGANRWSDVDEINTKTVRRLAPAWTFTLADASRLEVTPVVVGGVMYVTNVNECYALDAGTGRRIWHFRRPRTNGLAGDAASGINRGVAVGDDRVFMVTDHAHLLALNRFTGAVVWEATMADWRQNYGATSAPLVAGDLVISGVSGGDEGIRGFVAAFDRATGKEAWRFWTVPRPGEPLSETWRGSGVTRGGGASARDSSARQQRRSGQARGSATTHGDALAHGCAATWMTGSYDASRQTVYWPTGNPCPDYDGSERLGDNLYSDSILALDAATGTLRWYFQFTPHDLWDWDAQQPPMLVDAAWKGQPRALLLEANRNGFFYVLDRTSGALLGATPFVKKLTWARAIDARGRPVLEPGQEPAAAGTSVGGVKVCPAVEGATNWYSTAFSPKTGFYYVQTLEKCTLYRREPDTWRPGQSYYGGSTKQVPDEHGQKVLRAIDIQTGAIAWELPQAGSGSSWGGTLATAGGLVFVAEDSGALMAVDASTGAPLWQFQTNASWKASPMTYVFDGHQHIAIASGPNIIAFALVD